MNQGGEHLKRIKISFSCVPKDNEGHSCAHKQTYAAHRTGFSLKSLALSVFSISVHFYCGAKGSWQNSNREDEWQYFVRTALSLVICILDM